MEKVYRSKIDLWIKILLILIVLSMSLPLASVESSIGEAIIPIVTTVFIFHLIYTTTYTIKKDLLIVKSSFLIYEEIQIESIRKIKETRTLVASPATSLDRLAILFGSDMVIISPREKTEFIAHIQRLNPNVKIEYRK